MTNIFSIKVGDKLKSRLKRDIVKVMQITKKGFKYTNVDKEKNPFVDQGGVGESFKVDDWIKV